MVAHDQYGNNAIIAGASPWVEGKYRNAISFDGVDDNINILNSLNTNFSSAFTIELWVRIDSPLNSSQWTGIFGKRPGWSSVSAIGGAYNNIYFGVTTTSGTVFINMPQGALNVWQQIIVTYDNNSGINNLKLFRNGVLVARGNQTGNLLTTSDPWLVGKGPIFFKGAIDDIQLYNRSLTETDVALSYSLGDPSSFS